MLLDFRISPQGFGQRRLLVILQCTRSFMTAYPCTQVGGEPGYEANDCHSGEPCSKTLLLVSDETHSVDTVGKL